MLDHVFTDSIGALRDALEAAFLERQAFEEKFHNDILLGDLTWATSYALPGEGRPPRVRADITLDWPTWSQTAYRLWYISEPFSDAPHILVNITFRLQRLTSQPDPAMLLKALPKLSPKIGDLPLERSTPKVEIAFETSLAVAEYAIEVSYEGLYELSEAVLADGTLLDQQFGAMGGWIASLLVKLGDVKLDFLPPDAPSEAAS
jgi:hypothetical protein